MMHSKGKWWLIFGAQVTVLAGLGVTTKFDYRSHGEVSIFRKYAIFVWLVAMVLRVISLFLEPTSGED